MGFRSRGQAAYFITGFMPRNCHTLVFVTKCREKGRSFNYAMEHNDGYMGFFPPGGMLDARTPEGYANSVLTVPATLFLSAVEKTFPEIPDHILKRGADLRIGAARANLERMLLETFLTALRSGCGAIVPQPGQRIEARLRRLRQARDFVNDRLHGPIQLAVFCAELGLSRRRVEIMFQESLGISPITFLRHQRLHGVRRALASAEPVPGTIKETALKWGFWHMGRSPVNTARFS